MILKREITVVLYQVRNLTTTRVDILLSKNWIGTGLAWIYQFPYQFHAD